MSKFVTIRNFAMAATAASALISVPAFADQTDQAVPTTRVSYAGIDLSSKAGQNTMHARLRSAARKVCGYNFNVRELGEQTRQKACLARATDTAQVQLAAVTFGSADKQRVASNEPVSHRPAAERN